MLSRLRPLIRKEMIALLRDPRSRTILILPPVLQLFIFSFASTLEVKNNSIVIWNEDFGTSGTELIQRIGAMSTYEEVRYVFDRQAFDRAIENQQALVGLHIPENYSSGLLSRTPAPIQFVADGRHSNSGQIALGYTRAVVAEFLRDKGGFPDNGSRVQTTTRHWFNPNLHYFWFVIPCLVAILTTIMAMIVTALSVARERELGTFDQLRVSPLNPEMILIGKAIPAFFVSLFEASLIMAVGVWIFGIPFEGSLWLLYAAMSAYILALVGIGLFISSLCHTQQQAILGVFCFVLPAVLLSGFASPIDNMPEWLAQLTVLNPLKHFLIISKSIFLKDATPAMVWQNTYPLLIIAVVTLATSDWMFRRKSE